MVLVVIMITTHALIVVAVDIRCSGFKIVFLSFRMSLREIDIVVGVNYSKLKSIVIVSTVY
jgi:hypothetical protein